MQTQEKSAARTQGEKAHAEPINHPTKPAGFAGTPVNLTKRIGSTTYVVAVHFSQTSKETLEDKLLRLMEREVEDAA